jgi:hypothetical protein
LSEEAHKKFQTYVFFLRHFERLIRQGRPATHALTSAREAVIRKLLFNAWNSEMAARINSLFAPEVRVIMSQWKPTQTYYALYFITFTLPLH